MQRQITVLVTQHHNRLPTIIARLPVLPLSYICPQSHQIMGPHQHQNLLPTTKPTQILPPVQTAGRLTRIMVPAPAAPAAPAIVITITLIHMILPRRLAQMIINKIKQKFKVGDVPFP